MEESKGTATTNGRPKWKFVLSNERVLQIALVLGQMVREVGEWAVRNFGEEDGFNSYMGVIEEKGDLAHALLKMKQGIRGSTEKHLADARDAVADLAIYLCNFCSREKLALDLGFEQCSGDYGFTEPEMEGHLGRHCMALLDSRSAALSELFLSWAVETPAERIHFYVVGSIVWCLVHVCQDYKLGEFDEILTSTWATVKQRDWKKNPVTGDSTVNNPSVTT